MNPQIGQYHGVYRPESGGMKKVGKPGASESSREGHPAGGALAPHPETGVTHMTMTHKGEGRYETKTHHEGGGAPDVQQHQNKASAQATVDNNFPETGDHSEPDGDDGGSTAMGGMAGDLGEPS